MSPSVFIVRRVSPKGRITWQVRFRLGGREARPMSGGTFPTKREAELRQRWIAGELAAMRTPDLRALEAPAAVQTVVDLVDELARGRIDVGPATHALYRKAKARLGAFGAIDADAVRPADVREWIEALGDLAPATVAQYLSVVRLAFDEADLGAPNPARHRSVRLPRAESEETAPPSYADFRAIGEVIAPRYRFALELLERTGLRVSEAAALTWADVDLAGRRLRVPRGGKTRASRRFVPLVEDWAERIAGTCPLEDRAPGRLVLAGLTDQGIRRALARACLHAGVGHYSPHDLRHRYTSLLVLAGVPITLVREIVGHAKASLTLDTYAHVLLDEPASRLEALRRGVLVVSSWSAEPVGEGESPATSDLLGEKPSNGLLPPGSA